jgi:hypothetical protein
MMRVRSVVRRVVTAVQFLNVHFLALALAAGHRHAVAFSSGVLIVLLVLFPATSAMWFLALARFYFTAALYLTVMAFTLALLLGGALLAVGALKGNEAVIEDGYGLLAALPGPAFLAALFFGAVTSIFSPPGVPERRDGRLPNAPGLDTLAALKAEYKKRRKVR